MTQLGQLSLNPSQAKLSVATLAKGGKMKKLTLFLILIFLSSTAAFTSGRNRAIRPADKPQFKCIITGSDKDGFDIEVAYPEGEPKQCKATCEVTKFDNTKYSKEYEAKVHTTGSGWAWFGGEAGLKPAPLSDPRISTSSCD
jgi:hypothetical protein